MNNPSLRDWPEDAVSDPDNGAYNCQCIVCKLSFIGHKRRLICKICHEKDIEETQKRGDWLTTHNAPIDWVILTEFEIQIIQNHMLKLSDMLHDEWKARKALAEALSNLLSNRGPYQIDRAKEALEVAKKLDGEPSG